MGDLYEIGLDGMGGDEVPRINILRRRKHLLPTLNLSLQESLQFQKSFARDLIFQLLEPALVQCLYL